MYSDPSHASRGKVKQAPFLWGDRVDQYGASPMIFVRPPPRFTRPPPLFFETPTPSPSPQGGGGHWRHAQPTPSPLWGGLGWGSERKDLAKRRICPSSGCRHLLPVLTGRRTQGVAVLPPSPRRRGEGPGKGMRGRAPHPTLNSRFPSYPNYLILGVERAEPVQGPKKPLAKRCALPFQGALARALKSTHLPLKAGEVAAHVQGESLKAATAVFARFS